MGWAQPAHTHTHSAHTHPHTPYRPWPIFIWGGHPPLPNKTRRRAKKPKSRKNAYPFFDSCVSFDPFIHVYIHLSYPCGYARGPPRYHPFFFRRNTRLTPPILRNITVTDSHSRRRGGKKKLLSLERGGYKKRTAVTISFRV
jgi:hypothetical protein